MTTTTFSLQQDIGLAGRQVLYQQRAFWRNRRAAVASIIFPLMFLVVFGSLNHGQSLTSRGGLSYIDFCVPGIIAYAVVLIGFNTTAMNFAALRTNGTVKRIRVTPLPWSVYVLGTVGSTLLVMAIAISIMLAVGVSALGATFRAATVPGLVITLLLGCACFTTLGIGAARRIARPENGMGILMIVTLPLMFISNVFFPLDNAPDWLQSVARIFPVQPLADGLQVAFDPRTQGVGIVWHDARTLIIWTVVGCVSMLRYMRSTNQRA